MTTVLITGANRGIGFELAKQYVLAGDTVLACCRTPDKAEALNGLDVQIMALDVTNDASVIALKSELGDTPIDILINNAGVNLDPQSFEEMDFDHWEETFRVNSIGPFRVAQALIGNILAGKDKKLITISSKMGSLDNVYYGGSISYSSSKSAVNMVTKILANRFRDDGLIAVPMHPEWVRTDMGGSSARISVEESAAGLRKVIAELTLTESGRFFQYDGQELPW
jgi:NAD(P)-dependent dehydrogenase (short-subunit alcohol dehydrogenase family)